METIRTFRNITILLSALFCFGIVGSIEVERMTLFDGVEKMLGALILCVAVCGAEILLKVLRVYLVRYARRRRAAQRRGAVKRSIAYASR